MADVITIQELVDARLDAISLEQIINGAEWVEVETRLGRKVFSIATINALISELSNDVGVAINELQDAIDIAAAAGAGANGWTAQLVVDNNGNSLQSVKDRVVSPEDFYKNSDNGDYRPSFKRAIDYLSAKGGGTVQLTSGMTYLFKTNGGVNAFDRVFFVQVPSNISIVGDRSAVVKLDDNIGNYMAVFLHAGTVYSTIENVFFDGFTLDQNMQNNSTIDVQLYPSGNTLAGILLQTQNIRTAYVTNMCFDNSPGVHCVAISSGDGFDIRVNNNLFLVDKGYSSMPSGLNLDHSTVYIDGNGFQCNNNVAVNRTKTALGKSAKASAYEVHGSVGSCDDNIAFNFSTFCNPVGNVNSTSNVAGINEISIQRNKAYRTTSGIKLSAINGAPLRGVNIKDNFIYIDSGAFEEDGSAISGVSLWAGAGEAATAISNVDIQNNVIYCEHYTSDLMYGLSAAIMLESFNSVSNVWVKDNKIYNATNSGISIRQQQGAFNNINVEGNYIADAGQNTEQTSHHGIIWRGVVGNSKCTGNKVVDTSENLKVASAVNTESLSTGSTIVVDDNQTYAPNSNSILRNRGASFVLKKNTFKATVSTNAGLVLPVHNGSLYYDVDITAAYALLISVSSVSAYVVPSMTEITLMLSNKFTAVSNISFTTSFVLNALLTQLQVGQRCTIKFIFDGSTAKWYQSSPQLIYNS